MTMGRGIYTEPEIEGKDREVLNMKAGSREATLEGRRGKRHGDDRGYIYGAVVPV